jgi:hypothetical protein
METKVKQPTNRVGKVKLSIIMALVVILPIGALMIAVLRNGDAVLQSQLWQARAQEINRQVNQAIDGDWATRDDRYHDDVEQGLLEDFVEYDNNIVKLSIPNQLSYLLDSQVKEYIDTQIELLNTALKQLEQQLSSIGTNAHQSYVRSTSTRGEFRVESIWVQLAIDGAFFVVTTAIAAAKAVAWLTGKGPVVRTVKGAVNGIFAFLKDILPSIGGFIGLMINSINGVTDDTFFRWFSIGGIIANILDWTDSDKKLDGWSVYR